MTDDLITRWERVPVEAVIVLERQREVSGEHVGNLVTSYEEFGGQLQPILVDEAMVLIDGAHRLEAAKVSGWQWIDAGIARGNLTPEERSYAEASANAVRRELTPMQRKHLFETIFKPDLERRARERQKQAGEQRASERWGGVASENFSEATEEVPGERVSVAGQAQALVGLSAPTMAKLTELEQLAESDNDAVAKVATAALDRIDATGQVDGEYKVATRLAAKIAAPEKSPEQRVAEEANSVIGRVVNLVTLTEERLTAVSQEQLAAACRSDAGAADDLDGVLASLDRQLAYVREVRQDASGAVTL